MDGSILIAAARMGCPDRAEVAMRVLVQRVSEASVEVVDGDVREVTGRIGPGLVVLVGVTHDDGAEQVERLATKVANLRVFNDDDGVMNRSLLHVAGSVLVVSQFTLYGDARKGRRPTWVEAARGEVAEPLVDSFAQALVALGVDVHSGRFGTHMRVSLVNDGPVTLLLEA